MGVHPLIKIIIENNELYYLKPKQILSKLRDKDEIQEKYLPTKFQLASYISYHRRILVQKYLKNTQEDLREFMEKNSWEKINTETELISLYSDLTQDKFLLVFSSKTLLKNVINQKLAQDKTFIHIDATYKLMTNGFNLLTLGTENSSHNFRLIACAVSAHENTAGYKQFLNAIRKVLKAWYDFDWSPNYVISDAAECIHSAVNTIFPSSKHLRCMFHTFKAIKDKIHRWKLPIEKKLLKDNWNFICYNVKLLHKSQTEEAFSELWNLIETNWKEKYPENFVKYFQKRFINNRDKWEWVRKNLVGLNFTNNSLEKFHSDIKQTYTEKKNFL